MDADDCLGSLEVRLLRAAKPGHRRGDERAGATVGDDHAAFVEPLLRPAHAAEPSPENAAERPELVVAGLHDPDVRLGHLLPGALQVTERLRDDDARLVGEPLEARRSPDRAP